MEQFLPAHRPKAVGVTCRDGSNSFVNEAGKGVDTQCDIEHTYRETEDMYFSALLQVSPDGWEEEHTLIIWVGGDQQHLCSHCEVVDVTKG